MADSILKNDVDNSHDSERLSRVVDAQLAAEDSVRPKPFYLTSQFISLAVTWLVGGIVTFLISNGMLTEATAPGFQEGLIGVLIAVVGWVTQKYIGGRNEVTAIKVRSMATLSEIRAETQLAELKAASMPKVEAIQGELLRAEPIPMGGFFGSLGMVKSALAVGVMLLGNPKRGSKKAKALAALKLALNALSDLEQAEDDFVAKASE